MNPYTIYTLLCHITLQNLAAMSAWWVLNYENKERT